MLSKTPTTRFQPPKAISSPPFTVPTACSTRPLVPNPTISPPPAMFPPRPRNKTPLTSQLTPSPTVPHRLPHINPTPPHLPLRLLHQPPQPLRLPPKNPPLTKTHMPLPRPPGPISRHAPYRRAHPHVVRVQDLRVVYNTPPLLLPGTLRIHHGQRFFWASRRRFHFGWHEGHRAGGGWGL